MIQSYQKIRHELQHIYCDAELHHIFYTIAGEITGFSKAELIVNKNTIFSAEQHILFNSIIEKLKNFEPLQYILGEAWFYGLPFQVNASVLIPRPETEELVEWIVNDNKEDNALKIIDIGTGSGCIAISLKSFFTKAEITGTDISDEALKTAQMNASGNVLNVNFVKADISEMQPEGQLWDIIVSNPPYITDAEKDEMQSNVIDFEPHTALFVNNEDPLYFYRKIAEYANVNLVSNGKLYFEINKNNGEMCVDMLKMNGFSKIELRKDISGNDRMIRAER